MVSTTNRAATALWMCLGALAVFFFVLVFSPELRQLGCAWAPYDACGGDALAPLVSGATRIRWLISLLPAGIIVYHAMFLRYLRVRQLPGPGSTFTVPCKKRARTIPTTSARDLYFSASSIALRYLFPAVMTAALCSTMLAFVQSPENFIPSNLHIETWRDWPNIVRGLQCGFAGAYLYVLITLAHRTFRRDVSSGIAMWSAAMFVLGPALAAVFAFVWHGTPANGAETSFTLDVVLVGAGMAPRQFADLLQRGATVLTQSRTAPVSRRLMPLSDVRGITEEIEQRLAEEGISDAFTLAYCDPWLLMRSTSLERRQIAAWVDEALLMVNTDSYRELEKHGITGAIDLAWYEWQERDVKPLAKAAGVGAATLKDIVARLAEDEQVDIVWTLYQTDSDAEPHPSEAGRKVAGDTPKLASAPTSAAA